MKRYKGYYIDGVIFNSKEEIDTFLKNEIIKKIKMFSKMFESDRYTPAEKMAITREITCREKVLHDDYGMDWETIEMIPYTA